MLGCHVKDSRGGVIGWCHTCRGVTWWCQVVESHKGVTWQSKVVESREGIDWWSHGVYVKYN
jgi:hypothetical protein